MEYMNVLIVLLKGVARLVKHGQVRECSFDECSFGLVENSLIVLQQPRMHACVINCDRSSSRKCHASG